MHASGRNTSAILYLQRRIIANWFRRSVRSPFFWIVAAFLGFLLASQIAAVVDGPEDPGFLAEIDPFYLNAIAAVALFGGILVGIWRGTTNTPGASLADVVLMMGSPISSRLQFGLLIARTSLLNALIISVWSLAAASGAIFGVEDAWISVRIMFTVLIVVLLSELLRYAVWSGTEQIIARSPRTGYKVRLAIRAFTLGLAALVGALIVWPVLDGGNADWREAVDILADRGNSLASVPPMSLAASVFSPDGQSLLSGLALLALTIGTGALAIYWARDFIEPVAVSAERKTDPRGQMLEAGSDVQWAALSQFGVSPRLRVAVPGFGRGAWALLWGSVTRWVRYQIAAASITIFILGSFGALTAIGVRLGLVSVELAWVVAMVFPFFGSVNMFMDELRRQFLFLIPGSTWAKLTAAALTSVLDGLLSSLVVIGILAALGAIPLLHAAGLVLLGLAIALLGQSCLALVQVLLPFWAGQRVRVSITFGLTALAFLPALGLLVGLYIAVSPFAGLLAAAAVTLVTGALLLGIAGLFFDRMEFSG